MQKKIKDFAIKAKKLLIPDGTDFNGVFRLLPDGEKVYLYTEWLERFKAF